MTDEAMEMAIGNRTDRRRARWGRWLVLGLLVAFLGLLGFGVYRAQAGQVSHGPAPDFTLELSDGGTFRLSDQRGQVVMVDFWASWCIPCREEQPMLQALWQAYRNRGVMFVGVNYADTESEARAFLKEFGVTYPTGPDLGTRAAQAYRIKGVPEKFFVDKCGRVRAVVIGPVPEARLRQQIDLLLAEPYAC